MKEISSDRKALYYVGMALSGIGILLFLSMFLPFLTSNPFDALTSHPFGAKVGHPPFGLAIVGFAMAAIGSLVMKVGARGAAGSGLLLDPKRAEEDLEPWARMGGGLAKDALNEAGMRVTGAAGLQFDDKLRRLEALKKDGLISEAEFQKKRKEVLDEKL